MIGKKFGRLTILDKKESDPKYGSKWLCICECGDKKIVLSSHLKDGRVKSCGCIKSPKKDEYLYKLRERLIEKSERVKDCLIWKSKSKYNFGYGCIAYRGKPIGAHRASYLAFKGEIPKGMCVLHKCDNPACIEPNHLYLGNHADNVKDMMNKGRGVQLKGENHGNSVFMDNDINKIRFLFKTGVNSMSELSRIYKTSVFAISCIVNRITWNHIKDPILPNMNNFDHEKLNEIIKNENGFYSKFAVKLAYKTLNSKN